MSIALVNVYSQILPQVNRRHVLRELIIEEGSQGGMVLWQASNRGSVLNFYVDCRFLCAARRGLETQAAQAYHAVMVGVCTGGLQSCWTVWMGDEYTSLTAIVLQQQQRMRSGPWAPQITMATSSPYVPQCNTACCNPAWCRCLTCIDAVVLPFNDFVYCMFGGRSSHGLHGHLVVGTAMPPWHCSSPAD